MKPLQQAFGVRKVLVTTMQAISGAGYPGLSAFDIVDNAIPYIGGEEEKLEAETRKMLGIGSRGAALSMLRWWSVRIVIVSRRARAIWSVPVSNLGAMLS